ncbi:MAG: VCBS repeat-containing protein [Henriciella sp.]|uniref:FG-GAP repeat domain-containing protein n=1 Tax=Henriciella sp. TaxID=1968823 RepID=UPI003C77556C
MIRSPATALPVILLASACATTPGQPPSPLTVASTPTGAQAADGQSISWREHLIDDEGVNGGVPIRGGDGLAVADIDRDGFLDVISVHEDSNHLRIAFGSADPDVWELVTIGAGAEVGAIEDVAIGDLNGDGWADLVGACEEAHLIYFQNPGSAARTEDWASLIPDITTGRGSWLRAFIADIDQDGRMDVLAPNKGSADIIDPSARTSDGLATSLFTITGDPLKNESWTEQVLSRENVPNTAMPVDIDGDGDLDVLAAARIDLTMTLLENLGTDETGEVRIQPHPIVIEAGMDVPEGWQGRSNAFQSTFADLNGDGRKDLVVSVSETVPGEPAGSVFGGLGWLKQPATLSEPWTYFRIGDTLPDVTVGIALTDIDGDGDLDAVTGGYSGLNIMTGSYSGASRDYDEPGVTASATVGRIAWFENPGDARKTWQRHDVSRRVRGMYDGFVPLDMDGDGDTDLVSTRGNSGEYDGVFWLEQVRSQTARPAFTPARSQESRALPLPPSNWEALYEAGTTYIAPNKAGKD